MNTCGTQQPGFEGGKKGSKKKLVLSGVRQLLAPSPRGLIDCDIRFVDCDSEIRFVDSEIGIGTYVHDAQHMYLAAARPVSCV